ncbi:MAG: hypothetical protein BroJett015_07060 [Chloroflexota bacterium]|nr:MAG: hypothetical protein BroJett015_07060 [Chloroflexota bacterium]
MSTMMAAPIPRTEGNPLIVPAPLQPGDRLSRAEFERRYRQHLELKAELIAGVVYVSSPVHFQKHANPHFIFIGWLAAYQAATPGVMGADNAALRLDFENQPQPDVLLRLDPNWAANPG